MSGWLRDENPSKWAYFTAFPLRNDSKQSAPTTRFYSHADGFRNILKGFLQQLILSSLYGRTCEVLYFPIKDDESDLVILAGPKLYIALCQRPLAIREVDLDSSFAVVKQP
jgi:hypothetical protein